MALTLRGSLNAVIRSSGCLVGGQRYQSNEPTVDTSNVKGLSERVVLVPNAEVGPGASKNAIYKNPEYYCYNCFSFFDAELEMSEYRMEQPTNKRDDFMNQYEKTSKLN